MTLKGLGWVKTEHGWEIHPWGPWNNGYLVAEVRARDKSLQLASFRFMLFLLVIGSFAWAYLMRSWWPVLHCAWVGTLVEVGGIRWMFKGHSKVPPMGWRRGWQHLLGWKAAYALARVVSVVALSLTIYALYLSPMLWESYLLLVAIVCLQFFLNYFESLGK